ncbi:hypothetical protein TcWFU_008706 [Taenia crassiceps]|uniref:Uncharacterized protein n=1 Tax=Taenia crassiceps TaxID=6207 RepID=A0ABR4Q9U4_9CEST
MARRSCTHRKCHGNSLSGVFCAGRRRGSRDSDEARGSHNKVSPVNSLFTGATDDSIFYYRHPTTGNLMMFEEPPSDDRQHQPMHQKRRD